MLIILQYVDNSARILPHPDAASQYVVPIQQCTDIPNNTSARQFVEAYILDLCVTTQGDMKGKVWIQSQAKFSNIKRNTNFLNWLTSSTTRPPASRIDFTTSKMQGTTIVATGLFLNIVSRFDLVDNFQDQIAHALWSTIHESGPIPEFQIEPSQVNGVAGLTRLYKMLTSLVPYAVILNAKMAKIMPKPLRKEIMYISFQVWDLISKEKKIAYYGMQKNFSDNHGAMLLKGVRNPQAIIGKMNKTGTQIAKKGKEVSVYTWLTRLMATDGYRLFTKVLPSRNGEIELWHNRSHSQEAKAWATTALAEIARLYQVVTNKKTYRARADALFTQPDTVYATVAKLKTEVSLPTARNAYMEFQPPSATTQTKTAQQGYRNKRRAYNATAQQVK